MTKKIFMIYPCTITLYLCHKLNIGFATKCEVQRPMRSKMCLGMKHILTNGGKCKG